MVSREPRGHQGLGLDNTSDHWLTRGVIGALAGSPRAGPLMGPPRVLMRAPLPRLRDGPPHGEKHACVRRRVPGLKTGLRCFPSAGVLQSYHFGDCVRPRLSADGAVTPAAAGGWVGAVGLHPESVPHSSFLVPSPLGLHHPPRAGRTAPEPHVHWEALRLLREIISPAFAPKHLLAFHGDKSKCQVSIWSPTCHRPSLGL